MFKSHVQVKWQAARCDALLFIGVNGMSHPLNPDVCSCFKLTGANRHTNQGAMTSRTMYSAMAKEDVAPGEGALRMWVMLPSLRMTKSSSNLPLLLIA